MICSKCGNQLPPEAGFCGRCGSPVLSAAHPCPSCGAVIEEGALFCGKCGCSIDTSSAADITRDSGYVHSKKRHIVPIVIAGAVLALLFGGLGVGYRFYSVEKSITTEEQSKVTSAPESEPSYDPMVTLEPVSTSAPKSEGVSGNMEIMSTPFVGEQTPEPVIENSVSALAQTYTSRPDIFNSSLTYKRMSGIYNTSLTSDETFENIKNVIIEFDMACEKYVNGLGDVPSQLLPGSTAYNQQTGYKKNHPGLKQTYDKIDVINTREGGGYYYAWVTEVLSTTENNSSKTETDHWVYKLGKNASGWYIDDYTKDPAY